MRKVMNYSILAMIFGSIILTGCKGLVIKSGRTSDQTSANTSAQKVNKKRNTERSIQSFIVKKDVDVVFVKIKREFGFWTEQELRADFGPHQSLAETKIGSDGFAYSEVPGVFYNMRKAIPNQGEENKKPGYKKVHVIDVTIEKESATETKVSLIYWSKYDAAETAKYENWLKGKLEKALNEKLFSS